MAKRAIKRSSKPSKSSAKPAGKKPGAAKAKAVTKAQPKTKASAKAKPAMKAKVALKAKPISKVRAKATTKATPKAAAKVTRKPAKAVKKVAGKVAVTKSIGKAIAKPSAKRAAGLPKSAPKKARSSSAVPGRDAVGAPTAQSEAMTPAFESPRQLPREAPVSGPLPSRAPSVPYVPKPYQAGTSSPLDADPKRRRQQETSQQFAYEAAQLCRDDKCTEVLLLDVRGLSHVSDYIIVGSGTSDRQMKSVLDHVGELGQKYGFTHSKTNTDERSTWLLIDFVDVMVHLFEPSTRAHYDIEMLWGDAPRLEWERPDQMERDRAGLSLAANARR